LAGCQETVSVKISDVDNYEARILEQSQKIEKLSENKALLLEDYLACERELNDLIEASENSVEIQHQYEIDLEEEMENWNGNMGIFLYIR